MGSLAETPTGESKLSLTTKLDYQNLQTVLLYRFHIINNDSKIKIRGGGMIARRMKKHRFVTFLEHKNIHTPQHFFGTPTDCIYTLNSEFNHQQHFCVE